MSHYKNSQRGFTLIELLVVIAIIGILSSIVLASLNTARSKGNDAAIKANLATISVQAEMYYDTNGGYGTSGTSCTTAGSLFVETTIAQAIAAAESANGSGSMTCRNSSSAWVVSSPLSSQHWCVDSTGAKKQISSAPGTGSTSC